MQHLRLLEAPASEFAPEVLKAYIIDGVGIQSLDAEIRVQCGRVM